MCLLCAEPIGFFLQDVKDKIALYSVMLIRDSVITAKDVESIYEVPDCPDEKKGLMNLLSGCLGLKPVHPNLRDWDILVQKIKRPRHEVTIALGWKICRIS